MAVQSDTDRADEFIFDWNELNRKGRLVPHGFSLFDETLRDGLQNPSVEDPGIEDKLRILHLMDDLGIDEANVGLPGSSKRAFEDVLRLCKEVVDCKMKIKVAAAGRTVVGDITPTIEISQRAGIPIEVYAFIGSSPIRQYVEQWDVSLIAKRSAEAIDVAVKAGLPVAYVTEDTTRSRPEVLTHALPHGHRPRRHAPLPVRHGRATPRPTACATSCSSRASVIAGDRRHGRHRLARPQRPRLRAGERDLGARVRRRPRARDGARHRRARGQRGDGAPAHEPAPARAARAPSATSRSSSSTARRSRAPSAGRFRSTIRSSAATRSAPRRACTPPRSSRRCRRATSWLADRVYSGVPAGMFGRHQEIGIGFMSGASNVGYWLRQRNIEPSEDLVAAILEVAKATTHILSDEEVLAVIARVRDDAAYPAIAARLLGIDVGTTGVRAAVFDAARDACWPKRASRARTTTPAPGRAEADAEAWWTAVRAVVRAPGASGVRSTRCDGVAVTGQAPTAVLVDGAGRPLRPAILWLDVRADAEARALDAALGPGRAEAIGGNRMHAYFLGPQARVAPRARAGGARSRGAGRCSRTPSSRCA